MKYLLVVLDGCADRGKGTPFQVARKPNIDSLSHAGKNGMMDIGYTKDVNSDVGYLTLLSCYYRGEYPGRGYIEALGASIYPGDDDICIRANFATLDSRGNVKDRRAGRDETGLEDMAALLDGMEIDKVRFTVKKSSGHRLVIVMSGPGLSDRVKTNDPMKTGVPLAQITARSSGGKLTASVLNRFLYRANKTLAGHKANKKRELPANTILIRNVGKKKEAKSFEERYGLKGCCVAGVNVTKGVARFVGMDVMEVKKANGMPDTDLKGKRKACIKALGKYDFVFLHINGTDILAHDRDRKGKTAFLEKIDRELGFIMEHMDLEESVVVVTSDHRTVSLPRDKHPGYEHTKDPVPICISGDGIKPDGVKKFDEYSAERGSVKLSGTELIPYLLMLTKGHC